MDVKSTYVQIICMLSPLHALSLSQPICFGGRMIPSLAHHKAADKQTTLAAPMSALLTLTMIYCSRPSNVGRIILRSHELQTVS